MSYIDSRNCCNFSFFLARESEMCILFGIVRGISVDWSIWALNVGEEYCDFSVDEGCRFLFLNGFVTF